MIAPLKKSDPRCERGPEKNRSMHTLYSTSPSKATTLPPFLAAAVDVVLDVLRWHGGRMYLDLVGWREMAARGVYRAAAERALDGLHSAGVVHVRLIGELGVMVDLVRRGGTA